MKHNSNVSKIYHTLTSINIFTCLNFNQLSSDSSLERILSLKILLNYNKFPIGLFLFFFFLLNFSFSFLSLVCVCVFFFCYFFLLFFVALFFNTGYYTYSGIVQLSSLIYLFSSLLLAAYAANRYICIYIPNIRQRHTYSEHIQIYMSICFFCVYIYIYTYVCICIYIYIFSYLFIYTHRISHSSLLFHLFFYFCCFGWSMPLIRTVRENRKATLSLSHFLPPGHRYRR